MYMSIPVAAAETVSARKVHLIQWGEGAGWMW